MTTTTSIPDGPLARWLLQQPDQHTSPLPIADAVLGHAAFVAIGMVFVLIGVVVFVVTRRAHQRSLCGDGWALEIEVPPTADASGALVLWTNLHDLLRPRWRRFWDGQPHVVFELVWNPSLRFRIWAPNTVSKSMVRHAIDAAWPGVTTKDNVDGEIAFPERRTMGGELRLQAPEWFPLETDHANDPMRVIIGATGSMDELEGAVVQVLARPVTGRRMAKCFRAARAIQTGRPVSSWSAKLLDFLSPGPAHRPLNNSDPNRNSDLLAVRKKGASLGWEVVVRYGVFDEHEHSTTNRLKARAHGLASAYALFSGRNRLDRRRISRAEKTLATRRLGKGDLLSVPELAAIAHLPTDTVLPGVTRAGARSISPSPSVLRVGKVLGDSQGTHARPVAIAPLDARYHLHILGSTGSGKSTLLTNLVLQDVEAGRGAVVIDPKGDLITDILDRLPEHRANRVVLLDPDEAEAPPALNVLEGADPDLVVDHLVGIFRRIFEAYWGPRTDDVLRSACLTLLRSGEATLVDVPRLLTDENFRRRYTSHIDDPVGLGGFWNWYEAMSEAQQGQVIGPVMNKLRAFLLRPFIRNVMGSTRSSFDMANVLDGGLLLVRVPKGIVGDETARLLGSFVVAKVWQAATARSSQAGNERRDASLYVDECQNFLNLPRSFDEMLAEARGYGLSLVLAHQHLGQLSRELRDAISSNARNKVLMNVSPEDARVLEKHFAPELTAYDLSHLGAYQAAVRVVRDGQEQPAATIVTRPAEPASPHRARKIREVARRCFGRSAQQRATDADKRKHRQPSTGRTAYGKVYGLNAVDRNSTKHAGQQLFRKDEIHSDMKDSEK